MSRTALPEVPNGTKAVLIINPDGTSSAQLVAEISYESAPYGRVIVHALGNEDVSHGLSAAEALSVAVTRYWEARHLLASDEPLHGK